MGRRSVDAEALEALLEGRTSPDDAPRSLTRLAGLATAVRDHSSVEAPTDEFRTRLRTELLTVAAAGRPSLWDRTRDRLESATARMRYSVRTATAAALASTMIGTTGVAAAAQSALPGDLLYSVKGFTEDARLAFASGDVERGRLHLAFARERIEEVETGRERLSPDQLTETLDDLDVEAATGAEELLAAASTTQADRPALLDELEGFTAEMRGRVLAVSPDLPLSVRAATERTLEVLRRIDEQITGLMDLVACTDCADAAGTDTRPRVVLPGQGPATPCCGDGAEADADRGADGGTTTGGASGPSEQPRTTPTDPAADPDDPTGGGAPGFDAEAGQDVVDGFETAVDDLGTTVGDVGQTVGDTVGDVGETVGDTVGDVGETVGDTVGDVGSTADDVVDGVGDAVDDTGSLVDEIVNPSSTETSGPIGDTLGGVGDVLDQTGDVVEDTASELGDAVGDTLGGVGDAVGGLTGGLGDAVGGITGGGLLD